MFYTYCFITIARCNKFAKSFKKNYTSRINYFNYLFNNYMYTLYLNGLTLFQNKNKTRDSK